MLRFLDELPDGVDSKYRLVHIAAKRAKQITRGAQPLLPTKSLKPTMIALEEVQAGKLQIEGPPAEWEALRMKQAEEESRAAWFRHLPPEELMATPLGVDEEKEGLEELAAESPVEVYGAELDHEEAEDLEGGVEEFASLTEVSLEDEVGGIEFEGGKEGED